MAIIVIGTIIAATNAVAIVSALSNITTTTFEDVLGPSPFEDKATPIIYWFNVFLVAALPAFRFLAFLT